MDGVIVDTAKYHYLAWKQLALELGFDFKEEDNERLKGVSRMRSLEILLEVGNLRFDEDKKLELVEEKNNLFIEYVKKIQASDILPGVLDFLKELRNSGIKTAIGSASKNTPLILNRLQIENYFDSVVDGNSVSKAKPNPEIFQVAGKNLKLAPRECVVFEDAQAGVEAGKRAGMTVVGIGKKEILHKADIVIDGFQGIQAIRFLKDLYQKVF